MCAHELSITIFAWKLPAVLSLKEIALWIVSPSGPVRIRGIAFFSKFHAGQFANVFLTELFPALFYSDFISLPLMRDTECHVTEQL